MKKTYVTTMPDDIGAFLKASRCFAELDINITRVSYNKAIDSNTLIWMRQARPINWKRPIKSFPKSATCHPKGRKAALCCWNSVCRMCPAA